MTRLLIFLLMAGSSLSVLGEEVPPPEISITQVLLPLMMVIGLIFALAWLVKKMKVGSPIIGKGIQVRASTPLSSQARLCLVRVADKELLLGVTNQSVSLLREFDSIADPEQQPAPNDVADHFRRLLKRNEKPGS